MYIVRNEVRNTGMKFADAFYVATQYCICEREAGHSSLRISAEIKYIKNGINWE